MCLAIPGRVTGIDGNVGTIDYGGAKRKVRLDFVDVKVGNYVIVHAGYAIETMKEEEAKETLKILEEMLDEE